MREELSKDELIEMIKVGGHKLDEALNYYCRSKSTQAKVYSMVNRFGLHQEREDIFNESMLIFIQSVRREDFNLTVEPDTYLIAICINICKKMKKEQGRTFNAEQPIEQKQVTMSQEQKMIELERDKADTHLLNKVFDKLGERCREILVKKRQKYSMKEIGDILGISEQTVKNNHSSCKKKLVALIREDDEIIQLIKNRA